VFQNSAEPFVLGDRRVGDPAIGVEDRMGQDNAVGPDLNSATSILIDVNVFAREAACQLIDLQLDAFAIVLQHQIFDDMTLVTQTEDLAQSIRFDVQRTMQVVLDLSRFNSGPLRAI
jgi:hypothetical protein